MTNRFHVRLRQLPRNIYRDLSELSLEFQSTHSIHRAYPSTRRPIELDGDAAIGDPITYGVDDVIKHLRGACGLSNDDNSAATNQIRDSRREDDHE